MATEKSCASCGFLARRPFTPRQASTFFEMPSQTRRDGGGWWAMPIAGMGTPTVPACCVGAFPILEEIKSLEPKALNWRHKPISALTTKEEIDAYKDDRYDSTTPERNEAAKAVFNKLRPECHKWFPYTPGLGPAEHLQEFRMQQLENDRREFERKLTQMQIDASAEVNKAGIKISKIGMWIGIGAVILAVAEVLTMTEDAVLWKWIANIVSLIQGGVSQ